MSNVRKASHTHTHTHTEQSVSVFGRRTVRCSLWRVDAVQSDAAPGGTVRLRGASCRRGSVRLQAAAAVDCRFSVSCGFFLPDLLVCDRVRAHRLTCLMLVFRSRHDLFSDFFFCRIVITYNSILFQMIPKPLIV